MLAQTGSSPGRGGVFVIRFDSFFNDHLGHVLVQQAQEQLTGCRYALAAAIGERNRVADVRAHVTCISNTTLIRAHTGRK